MAAVHLGTLGPKLAKLSDDLATQARDQASRARAVADTMESLTSQLEEAIRNLKGSAGHVEKALATVTRIAEQTRILAINASVEAGRAGVHGRAFGVVVEEVQQLAVGTGATTQEIEARMQDMRGSISRVAEMTVAHANTAVHGIATSAGEQLASADTLKGMGTDIKRSTDALLLGVGRFRFAVHERAAREMGALVTSLPALSVGKDRVERSLESWLAAHRHFELVYVTNGRGQQVTDNIASRDGRIQHKAGLGHDWSARPWFRDAVGSTVPICTDLYLSSATGELCFTVAAALRDSGGHLHGVVGADVSFQQILSR